MAAPTFADPRAARWRRAIAVALVGGYAGYYLCRSNLSVVLPALVADPATGVDRRAAGTIVSAGVLAYAAGKSITGVAGDFIGGRRLFLAGLFGSVVATLAFSAGTGASALAICWVVNRFAQSAGWGGLTKIVAHWFPAGRYGAIMSVLSLSFLFGDAIGRYALGGLLSAEVGWRGLFLCAAGALFLVGLVDMRILRDSPRDVGLPEPEVHQRTVFGTSGAESRPAGVRALLGPYAASTGFWLVCLLSAALTLIREAFNAWLPVYLVDVHQMDSSAAARYSAVFPLLGGVSSLLVGALSDRVAPDNRVLVVIPAISLCTASLVFLAFATGRADLTLSLWAIGATAFSLLGPYTLLAGAIALDFGGRKGSATAAGLIDSAGYVGGALSGAAVGRVVTAAGWPMVFWLLAAVAVTAVCTAVLYSLERRRRPIWQPQFS